MLIIPAALAALTRYIGITLIVTGMLIVFWAQREDWRAALKRAFTFGFFASLPLLLLLWRNFTLTGTFFGERGGSMYSLVENMGHTFVVLRTWYLPPVFVSAFRWLIPSNPLANRLAYTFIGLLVGFAFGRVPRGVWRRAAEGVRRGYPLLLYTGIYLVILLLSATSTGFNRISSRLLSPIYIPLFFSILIFAQSLLEGLLGQVLLEKRTLILAGFILLWMTFPASKTIQNAINRRVEGAGGYNTVAWRAYSETAEYLRHQQLPSDGPVYTNVPEFLDYLLGITAEEMPSKTLYASPDLDTNPEELLDTWPEAYPAYLVIFEREYRPHQYSVGDLREYYRIDKIEAFEDGSLLVVRGRK